MVHRFKNRQSAINKVKDTSLTTLIQRKNSPRKVRLRTEAARAYFSGPPPVQMKQDNSIDAMTVHENAQKGINGPGETLPFLERIQASFGHHDITGVQAHTDANANEATASIGAQAYATGNHIAFGSGPSLHTAAHEAAHVVQQRSGKVQLAEGVGQVGDSYEKHADEVADVVIQGKSAEGLLDHFIGENVGVQTKATQSDSETLVRVDGVENKHNTASIDRKGDVQLKEEEDVETDKVQPDFKPEAYIALNSKADLASRQEFNLMVTNWSDAPEGTTYEWKKVGDTSGVFEWLDFPQGKAPPVAPACLKGIRPGNAQLKCQVTVSVPEQKPRVINVETALQIKEPIVQSTYTKKSADGSPKEGRLATGDLVDVDIDIKNVDFDFVKKRIGLLQGLDSVFNVKISQGLLQPTTKMTLEAFHIGTCRPSLVIPTSKDVTIEVPLEPLPSVEMDKEAFKERCGVAHEKINNAYESHTDAFRVLGNSYEEAWKGHVKTIEAQKKHNHLVKELSSNLIFSGVLAFLTGGVGNLVGKAMKDVGKAAVEVDAIKDLAKWGFKTSAGALKRGEGGSSPIPSGANPSQWKSEVIARIRSERETAYSIQSGWRESVDNPDFSMDFDPCEAVEMSLKNIPLPPPVPSEMSRQFELGLWKAWLQNSSWTLNPDNTLEDDVPEDLRIEGGEPKYVRNTGWIIKKRLDALGVNGAGWIERYAPEALKKLEADKKTK